MAVKRELLSTYPIWKCRRDLCRYVIILPSRCVMPYAYLATENILQLKNKH